MICKTLLSQSRDAFILDRRLSSLIVLLMLLSYPNISVGEVFDATNMIPLRGSEHSSRRVAKKQNLISNDSESSSINEGKKRQKKADKEVTFFDENDTKTEGTLTAIDNVIFDDPSLSPSPAPVTNLSTNPTIGTHSISPSLMIKTSDTNSKQIITMSSILPSTQNSFNSSLYPSSSPTVKLSTQPSIRLSQLTSSSNSKFSTQPSISLPLFSTSSPSSTTLSNAPSISPAPIKLLRSPIIDTSNNNKIQVDFNIPSTFPSQSPVVNEKVSIPLSSFTIFIAINVPISSPTTKSFDITTFYSLTKNHISSIFLDYLPEQFHFHSIEMNMEAHGTKHSRRLTQEKMDTFVSSSSNTNESISNEMTTKQLSYACYFRGSAEFMNSPYSDIVRRIGDFDYLVNQAFLGEKESQTFLQALTDDMNLDVIKIHAFVNQNASVSSTGSTTTDQLLQVSTESNTEKKESKFLWKFFLIGISIAIFVSLLLYMSIMKKIMNDKQKRFNQWKYDVRKESAIKVMHNLNSPASTIAESYFSSRKGKTPRNQYQTVNEGHEYIYTNENCQLRTNDDSERSASVPHRQFSSDSKSRQQQQQKQVGQKQKQQLREMDDSFLEMSSYRGSDDENENCPQHPSALNISLSNVEFLADDTVDVGLQSILDDLNRINKCSSSPNSLGVGIV